MNPWRLIVSSAAIGTCLALGGVAQAQTPDAAAASASAAMPSGAAQGATQGTAEGTAQGTAQSAMSDGEVRKVDKNAARLTLRHGPLAKLGMQGMTMSFAVQDARVLDQLKEGDKVRFAAERVNGVITVTAIEPVR